VSRKEQQRDELDRAIQRVLRQARTPRGVPIPGRGEPGDDELLRYVEGLLLPAERRHVEEALKNSPYSQSVVETLRTALAETGQGPGLTERAARYVFAMGQGALEFLRGATDPLQAPSVAWATRSAGAAPSTTTDSFYEFVHPFGPVQAHVKIEHVASSRLDVQLSLHLSGDDQGKTKPVTDARITLIRGGHIIDSMPVEESGSATLASLEPACYELEIRRAGKLLGTLKLDFLR
jgi:hypothetical protein